MKFYKNGPKYDSDEEILFWNFRDVAVQIWHAAWTPPAAVSVPSAHCSHLEWPRTWRVSPTEDKAVETPALNYEVAGTSRAEYICIFLGVLLPIFLNIFRKAPAATLGSHIIVYAFIFRPWVTIHCTK